MRGGGGRFEKRDEEECGGGGLSLQNVAKVHFYCNSIGGLQRENATAFSLASVEKEGDSVLICHIFVACGVLQ